MLGKFIRIRLSRHSISPTEPLPHVVMPGPDPGISLSQARWTLGKHVDGRVKPLPHVVMPGLDPGISLSQTHRTLGKHVDGRVKPGHDVLEVSCVRMQFPRAGRQADALT